MSVQEIVLTTASASGGFKEFRVEGQGILLISSPVGRGHVSPLWYNSHVQRAFLSHYLITLEGPVFPLLMPYIALVSTREPSCPLLLTISGAWMAGRRIVPELVGQD